MLREALVFIYDLWDPASPRGLEGALGGLTDGGHGRGAGLSLERPPHFNFALSQMLMIQDVLTEICLFIDSYKNIS